MTILKAASLLGLAHSPVPFSAQTEALKAGGLKK